MKQHPDVFIWLEVILGHKKSVIIDYF